MVKTGKRRFRDLINDLGDRKITLNNIYLEEKGQGLDDFLIENDVSWKELVVIRQYAKAIVSGDTKAAEFLRDTAGEKPTTEIAVQDKDSPLAQFSSEELKDLIAMFKAKQGETDEQQ